MLAVAAVLAVSAAAIARHYLHPAQLVEALARRVSQSTGRELAISGPVEVRLFPRPAIVVGDLRFRNAPWGSQPWMATIGRAEAEFPWRALLGGAIDITRLSVADMALLLETDASGQGNWVMGPRDSAPPDLGWLTSFDVDELTLHPLRLRYRNGATGEHLELALEGARLELPAAPRPISFRIPGSFAGTKFEARGTAGALVALLGNRPYPLALTVTAGSSTFEVSGEVAQPLSIAGVTLDLRAQGTGLAELSALAGRTLPALGPYRGSARLSGSGGEFSLSALELAVGEPGSMEFGARGGLSLRRTGSGPPEIPVLDLELQARGPELRELLALAGRSIPAIGPYAMAGRLSGSRDTPRLTALEIQVGSRERVHVRASGEIAKPREAGGLDLRVAAIAERQWQTGDESGAPRLPPFRLKTRLRDRPDGYALDELELEVAGSRLDAALVATRDDGRLRVAGRAASPLIDLARVAAGAEQGPGAGSRRGAGDTPHGALPALLHFADLDLDLRIGKLVLRDRRALTGISGHLALTRDGLAVSAGRLSAAGAQWRVQGRMADPARGAGMDFALEVRGGELADLFGFWGGRLPPLGPYQGSARALGSLEALRLTAIEAQAGRPGQARLLARGEVGNALRGEGFDLALSADISDPGFLSRVGGMDLPRLPPLKLAARLANPGGQYEFDDVKLAMGRSALQGRVTYLPAQPRPQLRAVVAGALLDLSEIRPPRGGAGTTSGGGGDPLKGTALDAEIRLERLVLPDRRAVGPVSGRVVLGDGKATLHELAVAVEGASAVLDGTVAEPLEFSGLDLAVKAEVKDSAALARLAEVEIPALPPFRLSGRLSDVENGYALGGLQLAFGATTVVGELTATRVASRPAVRASLTSPLFDLAEFLPAKPGAGSAKPAADGRLIPDAPLPFGVLRAADATLDLRVERLRAPDFAPLGPVVARLTLAGGRLKADPVRIGTPAGEQIEISGTVRALPGGQASLALSLEGRSINLGAALGQARKRVSMTGGATDFRLQLSSRGGSVRALMNELDGSAWIRVGPARVHNVSLDLGADLVQRVLDLINPFRKTDPDTELKCVAVRVSIADGVITSDRGIAVETRKFNAVASGTVNLGTEALALGVTPTVNEGFTPGTDQVAQNVRIGGTLGKPEIGLGVAGAARSAAALAADLATGGGWLLVDALLRKTKTDPHPCATALGESR